MTNFPLIDGLNFAIMEEGNRERIAELQNMKIREMEKILKERQDWDSEKRIYVTGNGYYKTKKPIQLCRAKKEAIIEQVFYYFYGNSVEMTLKDCFEKAIEVFKNEVEWKQRKSTTLMIYKSDWNRFFKNYPIANTKIIRIKNNMILNHLKQIVFDHNLSRNGLNNAKTVLNYTFDWAVNNDILETNNARNVSTKHIVCKQQNLSTLVYTDEEREKLLALMENDLHIASKALALMFCLCIRSGEVRALKWSDVDWDNRTIYIHSQISREHDENGRNIYVHEAQTKNRDATGNRYQGLSGRALEILKRQRKENPFSTYIFEYNGHILEPNMLNRRLKKICALAEIQYLSCHKIRFWSVTKMVQAGVSPVNVQAMAGHKNKATTDHYVRVGRQETLDNNIIEAIYG